MSGPLDGKTVFITGGTRGIGRAIALKCAQNGANVAVVARNTARNTIAEEIRAVGARALVISCDVQHEDQVKAAIEQTAHEFGGIDILVNNATILVLKSTADISMSEYDLMANINTRGSFSVVKHALKYLQKSSNGHILTLCPMPQIDPQWFQKNLPYTMSKFSMGLMAFGLSEEQRPFGVASNTLWPFTTIDTDGLAECGNKAFQAYPRKPTIMADAAFWIITQDSRAFTGNFCIDEIVLREAGTTDFAQYNAVEDAKLSELSRDHMVSPEQFSKLMKLRELAGAADSN
ncbi:Hydroxysteroid dehydrogenase-like protein 2 [Coemansia sp. RSA 1813]|nr:Hydroxysteroid dehydrogenase-like protein 2 [Coemansia sp. RSA 1646]KAJ1768917.1 Hydroxysteroid dehydrogenase-like protein 2 [Coemansia sp. RSA 1843]KAJ2087661.1 Hydroxysteroid dehydrogenase-like protein 2 [Coemansia sp. RSA 986]KAJ2212631.1 Hydroxysteroid dehydrogenase-like protein 2 [Coemansia sp. RSA 487]KAJ2567026.1 Hydroxysteroid dehydrogenase-like protein 2 [Coemansia sp. RSA 1813]